jgi:hypothetical protein
MTKVNDLIRARASMDPFGRPSRESIDEYDRLKASLNEEARTNWDDERWHREVAAVVASRLDYGFQFENLFGSYFQVSSVGEFDTVELTERRGLKVFYTSRGGYIEESQLKTERWTLPRDTIGFHVSEHDDKLRANFAETIESLVGLAEQRLDAEINRRMFNLLQAAIPNVSPYYVASTGLTSGELNDAIRDVGDSVKPNGAGRAPITIIGRAAMVDAVSDIIGSGAGNFTDAAAEELRARGMVGTYRGANVVRVFNYTDENGDSYIPANELWVFGGNVGQFAFYGGMQTKSWEENTVDYRHYRGRRDIGGLIHHPEQARRIVDSTVTP